MTEPTLPEALREILSDGLTEKGLHQWWRAHMRYLHGERPCDVWERDPKRVLEAAHAWATGAYL